MLQIGMVAVALGIIGLIWGIFQRVKAGRVAGAPLVKTGDAASQGSAVAGPKGAISVQGNVVCPQPLVSPVTGTPCLYYQVKVTATWKDGDTTKTKELHKEKVAAPFQIDDGSGPVRVNAGEGGDFEPTTIKDETKGTGLLGGITGGDIVFGNFRVQTGMLSLGTKYNVVEEVMPLQPKLYACGKTDGGAIAAPGWRSLILSNKTRDELLAHATKSAKMFLAGGAALFVVGAGLATVAGLTGEAKAEAAPAVTATATATVAAAPTAAEPAETAAPSADATQAPPANRPAAVKPAAKPTAAPAAKPARRKK